jgi:hypothetical protein
MTSASVIALSSSASRTSSSSCLTAGVKIKAWRLTLAVRTLALRPIMLGVCLSM